MLHRLRAAYSTSTALIQRKSQKQQKFTQLIQALDAYRSEHGHFSVPSNHEIVLETSMTNYPLGRKLQGLIRKLGMLTTEQRKSLEKIGFPIEWQKYHLHHIVFPALGVYRKLYGHLRIPQAFVVPRNDLTWPSASWGLRLGNRVRNIRQQAAEMDTHDIETLDELGFVWNVSIDRLYHLTIPAIKTFKEVFGHTFIPLRFQVPQGDPAWPSDLYGFQLGHSITSLRNAYQHQQLDINIATELESLGINMNESRTQQKWNTTILPALQTFVSQFGHCDVPQDYIVPMGEDKWPRATWNLHLGRVIRDIRYYGLYSNVYDVSLLNSLGFLWNREDKLRFQVTSLVLPALNTFNQLHGHLFIPSSFVVPTCPTWPRLTHGFHLGGWIARRRLDATPLSHDLQFLLEEAGIVWRYFDARFENIVLPAFEIYAKLYGTCANMPSSFRVPRTNLWPSELWDLNLGGTLWHIRNGDSFVSDAKKFKALVGCGVFT